MIDTDIIGIEMPILRGSDKHSFLNKGNKTQGSGKAVSPRCLLLDIPSNIKFVVNRELVKYTRQSNKLMKMAP